MTFDFRLLYNVLRRSLIDTKGTNVWLSVRRVLLLLILCPVYIMIEFINWLSLLLDKVLFPRAILETVQTPVFILGPPRCGTTLLHRLLSYDEEQFTAMRLWEIFFAPSVIQKKILCFLGRIDRIMGDPGERIIKALEKRLMASFRVIHPIGLFEVEEDSVLLLHIFGTSFLLFVFPFLDVMEPYLYFDTKMPESRRRKIMAFYRRCLQNHLYAFGRGRRFLSKNPFFSPFPSSLAETFPDGKFILIVRDPKDVVPSMLSLTTVFYRFFMSPIEDCPYQDDELTILRHYYTYPLAVLEQLPYDRHAVITYPRLVADPEKTFSQLYERFGFSLSDNFRHLLLQKNRKASSYKSNHTYDLERFGLTPEEITDRFGAVYERFNF
jgi:omega-hydroxy-beta-dihydromenaquinone-9 sulfotransferase